MKKTILSALLLALMATTSFVAAQVRQAQVSGHVKDENGQPLAGVYVIFQNKDAGYTSDQKTDKNGGYAMLVNPAGANANGDVQFVITVKKDKKDKDNLYGPSTVVVTYNPDRNVPNIFDFPRAADSGGGSGMTAEQKREAEERKKQNEAIMSENKKRGAVGQLLNTAFSLHAAGNLDQALATAKQATDAGPQYAATWSTLGQMQLEAASKASSDARAAAASDAVTNLKKAIELCATAPTDADKSTCAPTNLAILHQNIGKALLLQNKPDDAAAEYRLAAQTDSVNADKYLFSLGLELYNRSKLDAANAAFTEALAKNPNNADAYLWRGMTQFNKASIDPKTNKAIYPPGTDQDLKKYLELAPTGPNAAMAQEALKEMQKVTTSFKAPKK
jgi:tetratricopeptide (TPR) repeat protein